MPTASEADGRPDGQGRRPRSWCGRPSPSSRTAIAPGIAVVIFLLFATVLGYFAYRQIWAEAKRVVRPTGPLDPANQAKSRSAKGKAGIEG